MTSLYRIYIRKYYDPGTGENVDQETTMYELPLEYFNEDDALIDPKVKTEMGKAGSFEFSMQPNNKWYDALRQMLTLIRVKFKDETIFYGRVLSIDTDMWGKRQVHCEGALAFLLDTMQMATKESERVSISLETYVKDLIDSHNNLISDEPNKKFEYGEIPGYYSQSITDEMKPESESRKFGTGSWTSTLNCLEDLTSKYGGFWRARYNDSNGKLYLDWLLNYFDPTINEQALKLSENIVDMSNTVDVNGVFTVLIPEGTKNGKSLYLDDIPKTVAKVSSSTEAKTSVGPGLGEWEDGHGMRRVQ